MKTIKFKDWTCTLEYGVYENGRTAITLIGTGEERGEPIAVATVNIPEEKLEDDEILIKNYSENEGMYEALLKAEIIGDFISHRKHRFVMIPKAKLLISKKQYARL
jgi:hypothetical protein